MKDNNVDQEFLNIDKENKYKDYIIAGILYIIVIILSVFFIIGVKNQKDEIESSINNNLNDNANSNINEDNTITESTPSNSEEELNIKDDSDNSDNLFENISSNIEEITEEQDDELNILDQIQ